MTVSRRRFLTYLGLGSYAALRGPLGTAPPLEGATQPANRRRRPSFFEPILPDTNDQLVLPAGYRYDVVCAWGDPLGSSVPQELPRAYQKLAGQPQRFGFNCDFLAYFPLDALQAGAKGNSREGLLWVNHEYPDPLFVSNYPRDGKRAKTRAQIL